MIQPIHSNPMTTRAMSSSSSSIETGATINTSLPNNTDYGTSSLPQRSDPIMKQNPPVQTAHLRSSSFAKKFTPLIDNARNRFFDEDSEDAFGSHLSWYGAPKPAHEPPSTGSVFTSTVNLSACAFGASMLSIPYVFQLIGLLPGVLALVFIAILSFGAAWEIFRAGRIVQRGKFDEIVEQYFGRVGKVASEIMLAICLFVAAVSYVVGLTAIVPRLIPASWIFARDLHPKLWSLIISLIQFPMTLLSTLSVFGPSSLIACIMCYIQALVLFFSLIRTGNFFHGFYSYIIQTKTPFMLSNLLKALPLVSFPFAYHYVLTDTFVELRGSTARRTNSCLFLTNLNLLLCYIIFGVSGFLYYHCENWDVPKDVFEGFAPSSFAGLLAQACMGFLLFFTYPLFLIPLKRRVASAFIKQNESRQSATRKEFIAAVFLGLLVFFVSISLSDLTITNSIAGGCIALVMFVFPGSLLLKGMYEKFWESWSAFFTFLFGCTLVFVGWLIFALGFYTLFQSL